MVPCPADGKKHHEKTNNAMANMIMRIVMMKRCSYVSDGQVLSFMPSHIRKRCRRDLNLTNSQCLFSRICPLSGLFPRGPLCGVNSRSLTLTRTAETGRKQTLNSKLLQSSNKNLFPCFDFRSHMWKQNNITYRRRIRQ